MISNPPFARWRRGRSASIAAFTALLMATSPIAAQAVVAGQQLNDGVLVVEEAADDSDAPVHAVRAAGLVSEGSYGYDPDVLEPLGCDVKDWMDDTLGCLFGPVFRGPTADSKLVSCEWNGHLNLSYWRYKGAAYDGEGTIGSYIDCTGQVYQLQSYVDVYRNGAMIASTNNRPGTTKLNDRMQGELGAVRCSSCNGVWRVHWYFTIILSSGDEWGRWPDTNCDDLSERTLTCHYVAEFRI